MKIVERRLAGVFEVDLDPHRDDRGFFLRTFDQKIFRDFGIHREWVQENHSRSQKKGILRGLHFQFPPYAETKLVRCVGGKIFDVFVDLRKGSPTFGQWDAVELSEDNHKCIFIPRGFAHGFCTLTARSDVLYKVDNYYSPGHEGGVAWNDTELAIEWPEENPLLSKKERRNPTLAEFVKKYGGIEV